MLHPNQRHVPQHHPAFMQLHEALALMNAAVMSMAEDPSLSGSDTMLSACCVYDQLFALVVDDYKKGVRH